MGSYSKTKTFSGKNSLVTINNELNTAIDKGVSGTTAWKVGAILFTAFTLLNVPACALATAGCAIIGDHKDSICKMGQRAHMLLEDYEDRLQNGQFTDVVLKISYKVVEGGVAYL